MSESKFINETSFSKEIRFGFSEYAKYVISDRALPDGRDGLKPVHRRIIYAMHNLGLGPRSAFKKCARIVGETTGRYHPHAGGVYESLVRLGQDWSLRYPLVEPQGNFGSIDGYPPAAMRYTEARLTKISVELLENISPNVVEFIDNFDGEEQEPTVFPVKVPHLLLNGTYGIAVGISSNIPPHNLTELLNACIAMIDNPRISVEELMGIVTGPDFPTGGVIVGLRGIYDLYRTGAGSMRIRSRVHVERPETHKIKENLIVVDEIPYLQNKAKIIEHIASLIDDNKIRGIKDVRDLSKDKIRIEIVLEAQFADDLGINTILAQLYKKTNLETLFHARINAFVYGTPMTLNLKQALAVFLDFREKTVRAIAQEELDKVLARLHILEGLIIASDHISDVISLIRNSDSRMKAQEGLMSTYGLSELQAKAVLDMTLGRLARMEQGSLRQEAKEKEIRRDELNRIIHERPVLLEHMKQEFYQILENNKKDARRTSIQEIDDINKPEGRPILHQRDLLITLTSHGYLRAIDATVFKVQGRGGKGVAGVPLEKDEKLLDMKIVSNLEDLLLITEDGRIFQIPAYDIPEVKNRTAKGQRYKRYINTDAKFISILNVEHDKFLPSKIFVNITKKGMIKRTRLSKYKFIRKNGIKCLNLKENDAVVSAFIYDDPFYEQPEDIDKNKIANYIVIVSKKGKAVVFHDYKARLTGRVSQGVIAMKLAEDDEVVSAFTIPADKIKDTSILTVTDNGKGKRSPVTKYRVTNRGTKGVINIKLRNNFVISSMPVPREGKATISLINSSGTLIKVNLKGIRNMGRNSQGVRIMRLKRNEKIIMASSVVDESTELEVKLTPEEEKKLEEEIKKSEELDGKEEIDDSSNEVNTETNNENESSNEDNFLDEEKTSD